MAVCKLKKTTMLLVLLSLPLLLLITNSPLKCEPLDRGAGGVEQGRVRASDEEEKQGTIARAQAKWSSVQPSCHQVYSNASYPASILAIGSLNLASAATEPELLSGAASLLPHTDCVVSTLVSPIHCSSSNAVSQTLRYLKSRGVELLSLATESMYSGRGERVKSTTQCLEDAGIRWGGVTLKENNILVLNGLRVGFLAFCAVYGECVESASLPYAPVKYSAKTVAGAVSKLKLRGVDVIVVMVRWGRGGSYYPDGTVLAISRYLASLGVALILGYHPLLQQDHAYFQDTLVIFSAGNFFSPSSSQLCWQQSEDGATQYSTTDHCASVHPSLRSSLMISEQHTTMYHLQLSRSSPVLAEYVSLPLKQSNGLHLPEPGHADLQWTRVCGRQDTHCLACNSV